LSPLDWTALCTPQATEPPETDRTKRRSTDEPSDCAYQIPRLSDHAQSRLLLGLIANV